MSADIHTIKGATVKVRLSGPKLWLHLEGVAVLAGAVTVYAQLGFSWWLFAALILAPDLAMLGYLINPRSGAFLYNLLHNYLVVLACLGIAFVTSSVTLSGWLWAIGLIWLAHVGMDRMFGYGLKYGDGFKHTHLNEV